MSDFAKSSGQYREKLEMKYEKLRMSLDVTMDMFKPAVDSILRHVEELVSNPVTKSLKNIILVGGLSDCKLSRKP